MFPSASEKKKEEGEEKKKENTLAPSSILGWRIFF